MAFSIVQLVFYINCVIVSLNQSPTTNAFQLSKLFKNPPDIRLFSYLEPDSYKVTKASDDFVFKEQCNTDFISKNGSDYFVQFDVLQISFVCQASYPITWTFPHMDQLSDRMYYSMESEESREALFQDNMPSPTNIQFSNKIIINLGQPKFLSLNLTCSSVGNKSAVTASIHMFLQGEIYLENEGKFVDVEVTQEKNSPNTFVIPCRVRSPDIPAVLEIEHNYLASGEQTWNNINNWAIQGSHANVEHAIVNYNPKIGYTIRRDLFATFFHKQSLVRLCRCSTVFPGEKQYHVYFKITLVNKTTSRSQSLPTSTVLPFHNVTLKSAKFVLTPGDNRTFAAEVSCCSGKQYVKPRMTVLPCRNPVSCRLRQHFLYSGQTGIKPTSIPGATPQLTPETDCAKFVVNVILANKMYIVCDSNTIHIQGTFLQLFNPDFSQTQNKLPNTTEPVTVNSLTHYQSLANVTNSQKIAILTGQITDEREIKDGKSFIYFLDEGKITHELVYNEDGSLNKLSWMYIKEYSRDQYYVGEALAFFCIGVKHFYSHGAQLSLTWKNGTQTAITNSRAGNRIKLVQLKNNKNMFGGYGIETRHVFAEPLKASLEMRKVNCWMPLEESTEWDTFSKEITVLPSVAPRFLESQEETLYFYLGDEGHKLVCTIVEAKPFPRFQVLWNRKPIASEPNMNQKGLKQHIIIKDAETPTETETTNKTKNLIRLEIEFDKIEHGFHGTYQCIATNINSTVTRTVYVIVQEKRHTGLLVSLALATSLLVILVVLVLKHWKDKRMLRSYLTSSVVNSSWHGQQTLDR